MGNNGIFHFARQAMRILAAALICLLLLQPSLALTEAEVQEAEMGPQVVLLLSENATELGIPVETQYATFYFPVELADQMQFTIIEMDEGSMLIASTIMNDEEIQLYFLSMGQIEMDGSVLGMLRDEEKGELMIYMMMAELPEDLLSEEQLSKVYELQESVNEIVDQLMEDPRYVTP